MNAGFDRDELNMVFAFDHAKLSNGAYGKWNDQKAQVRDLANAFATWQTALYKRAWNCLFWSNHDQPRAVSKFGDERPEYRALSAKMLATFLYLMQGTPYIYQGEELGMTNMPFRDISECRDIESINAYSELVRGGKVSKRRMMDYISFAGRDNARTPMQWDASEHAGFSAVTPWIAVNPNYTQINAADELANPDSVLRYYQKLLRFRKHRAIIREGDFSLLTHDNDAIQAYVRRLGGEALYVLCNFTDRPQSIRALLPETPRERLLGNYPAPNDAENLRPYEAAAYQI